MCVSIPGVGISIMQKLNGYLRIKAAAEFLGISPNTRRNCGRNWKITEHCHPINNDRLFKKRPDTAAETHRKAAVMMPV